MYSKKNNTIICQNCGEKGHHVKECPNPTTSLGVLAYRYNNDKIEYLMVCRRNTIGFVEFIRGKYANSDIKYIQKLFDVMTNKEIDLLKTATFDDLCEYLWMDKKFNKKYTNKVKRDYNSAIHKYNKINNGYVLSNKLINIPYFIENKSDFYTEQEWGFPKGRRNHYENNFQAATREFYEETGIPINNIDISNNSKTFSEVYNSYDNIKYQNVYYIAYYNGDGKIGIDFTKQEQYTEISQINFFDFKNAITKLRDYDDNKRKLITEINEYLIDRSKD